MFSLVSIKGGINNVKKFYSNGYKKIGFIFSDTDCEIESIFTNNKFQAAPIKHYKKYPQDFKTNLILLNSGNANAMTGENGLKDIDEILKKLSEYKKFNNPIVSSTGVIGYRLDKNQFFDAFYNFNFSDKNSNNLSKSIMTTDAFKKELCFKIELEDGSFFHIAGVAKGAGMINPSMATMLSFIITDAKIPKKDMKELLKESAENSFNKISVDGDTSTNDTLMLISNGEANSYNKDAFRKALNMITFEFAMMILKDGEGAEKLISFEVKGAKTYNDAKKASISLSNSLLVKTALFGEDPNWGRIASTIGASEINCDESKLTIYYDDLLIFSKDYPELDKNREEKAIKIMKQSSFKIVCDLNLGDFNYKSYGCDLNFNYIKINSEYRT